MLKHIKKIYSDLTEFFLVLLTGLFAGSIFTLAYIKYRDTSKVTFADIGGMLAGAGTIGLFALAFLTINSWHKQNKISLKQSIQIELQNALFDYLNFCISYGYKLDGFKKAIHENSENSSNETAQVLKSFHDIIIPMSTQFIQLASIVETKSSLYEVIHQKAPPIDCTIKKSGDKINSLLNENIQIDDFIPYIKELKTKSQSTFILKFKKIIP